MSISPVGRMDLPVWGCHLSEYWCWRGGGQEWGWVDHFDPCSAGPLQVQDAGFEGPSALLQQQQRCSSSGLGPNERKGGWAG